MKTSKKQRIGLISLLVISLFIGLCGCSKNFPTENDILDEIEDVIFEEEEISSIEILEEKETTNGIEQIILVTIDRDNARVFHEYEIKYEFDDGEWKIEEYECLSTEYEPLEGVNVETSNQDFLEMIGDAYYVENYSLIGEECDLEAGEMICIYQYTIVEEHRYEGEATIYYVFDNEAGEWVCDDIDLNIEEAEITDVPSESDSVTEENENNDQWNEEASAYLERAISLASDNWGYPMFTALYGEDFCMTFMSEVDADSYIVDVYFYDESDEECAIFELALIEKSNTALIESEYANFCETADMLDYFCMKYESTYAPDYEIIVLYDYRGMLAMSKEERYSALESMGYNIIFLEQTSTDSVLSEEELYGYIERGVMLAYSNYGYELTTRLVGEDYIISYLIGTGDVADVYGNQVTFFDSDGNYIVSFEFSYFYKENEEAIEENYEYILELCEEWGMEDWGEGCSALIYESPNIEEYTIGVTYFPSSKNSTKEETIEYYRSEGFPIIYVN